MYTLIQDSRTNQYYCGPDSKSSGEWSESSMDAIWYEANGPHDFRERDETISSLIAAQGAFFKIVA